MALLVRVNEYRKNTDSTGKVTIDPTSHGIRINPANVVKVYTAGLSSDDHNVFTVTFVDGRQAITDWAGVELINGWAQPTHAIS